jgi:D-threo-aldose 1-dehydrogenase
LKRKGYTNAVGIGAKDWRVIREITDRIELDWVMLALSFTVYTHPNEILDFMNELQNKGIGIINSAVFHSGFLSGGQYFDYRLLDQNRAEDRDYFLWRDTFFNICDQFGVKPATACVQFGLSHPGIISIALNTSKTSRIEENIGMIEADIPNDFWIAMINSGLISREYPQEDR